LDLGGFLKECNGGSQQLISTVEPSGEDAYLERRAFLSFGIEFDAKNNILRGTLKEE
jgi:hypothetical protein